MAHVYCPECGYNNPESAHFCAKCGAALVVPEEGESTEAFDRAGGGRASIRSRISGCTAPRLIVRSGGGRSGEIVRARRRARRRSAARPSARSSSTTSPSPASTPSSRRTATAGQLEDQGSLNGTFVNRERVETADAQRRRRAPDRQVPAHVPPALMAMTEAPSRRRLLTIGTVCNRLKDEFPDVSISKIRYLEDQGLLNPRRTQGGYRLFSEDDVERLETILRLQRDEFLPLRVIREELEAGRRQAAASGAAWSTRGRRSSISRSSATAPASRVDRARQLEEFGLLESAGRRRPADLRRERRGHRRGVRGAFALRDRRTEPARLSHRGRPRERACSQAVIAPALRSRNAERRQEALGDLQRLAQSAQELADLLLRRNVRRLVD